MTYINDLSTNSIMRFTFFEFQGYYYICNNNRAVLRNEFMEIICYLQ